jgi:uncharacterized membrane protein YbaN (DUF454 family)/adenylate kinase family enzyme
MTRLVALVLAYFFLALAIIGVFLPGLPTVPFLLLVAWFSARGSERLHRWLYEHPHLGKLLIDWESQRAISRASKVTAVVMLIVSWVVMYYRLSNVWVLAGIATLFILIAAYLTSRPEPRPRISATETQGSRKILIFGNSGSGKSTLAKKLCDEDSLAHLDLDTLAWRRSDAPVRKPLKESEQEIAQFIRANPGWVIEGCYTDLLELAAPYSSEIIFLNLPVETCIANAKKRPWEPHKYESKDAQDANLAMLIDWIAQYTERDDTFSRGAHEAFYEAYAGQKKECSLTMR